MPPSADSAIAQFRNSTLARVAQLTERWSYKPKVEGLSPSLGTKNRIAGLRKCEIAKFRDGPDALRFPRGPCLHLQIPQSRNFAISQFVSGRDSSRQNVRLSGSVEFEEARCLTPRPELRIARLRKCELRNFVMFSCSWMFRRFIPDRQIPQFRNHAIPHF